MKKNQDLSRIKLRNDIPFGSLLMGTTGVLIGVVVDSEIAMVIAGVLGALNAGGRTSFIFTGVVPEFMFFTVFVILVTTSSIYRL